MNTNENKNVDKDQSVRRKSTNKKQSQEILNAKELLEGDVAQKEVENVEKTEQLKIDTKRLSNKMKDFKITEQNKLLDPETSNISFNASKEMNESVQNNWSQQEEALRQKIRNILKEFSPKNFDIVVEKIVDLQIDDTNEMNTLIQLIFEEAILEFSSVTWYARLCRCISEKSLACRKFRNVLIDKAECEFMTVIRKSFEKSQIIQRKRCVGIVQFVGELYNQSVFTDNIIANCIETLLDPISDYKLECLCELLNTVGPKFDVRRRRRFSDHNILNRVILKMQKIVDNEVKDYVISKRVLFMLQNVINLRKKNLENL